MHDLLSSAFGKFAVNKAHMEHVLAISKKNHISSLYISNLLRTPVAAHVRVHSKTEVESVNDIEFQATIYRRKC